MSASAFFVSLSLRPFQYQIPIDAASAIAFFEISVLGLH